MTMTIKQAVTQLYRARDAIDALLEAYEQKESGSTQRTPKKTTKRFVKPTMQEWLEYGKTLSPVFDHLECGGSYEYYEANGWKVGKNPMKDWQAACRQCHKGWIKRTPNVSLKTDTPTLYAMEERLKLFKSRNQGGHTTFWDFLSPDEVEECKQIISKIKDLKQ